MNLIPDNGDQFLRHLLPQVRQIAVAAQRIALQHEVVLGGRVEDKHGLRRGLHGKRGDLIGREVEGETAVLHEGHVEAVHLGEGVVAEVEDAEVEIAGEEALFEEGDVVVGHAEHLEAGLEKNGFKKNSPVGFLGLFGFFGYFGVFYIFAQKREFLELFQFQEYF
jgi:hypothetical protein